MATLRCIALSALVTGVLVGSAFGDREQGPPGPSLRGLRGSHGDSVRWGVPKNGY